MAESSDDYCDGSHVQKRCALVESHRAAVFQETPKNRGVKLPHRSDDSGYLSTPSSVLSSCFSEAESFTPESRSARRSHGWNFETPSSLGDPSEISTPFSDFKVPPTEMYRYQQSFLEGADFDLSDNPPHNEPISRNLQFTNFEVGELELEVHLNRDLLNSYSDGPRKRYRDCSQEHRDQKHLDDSTKKNLPFTHGSATILQSRFSMIGREHVDFLSELGQRSQFSPVLCHLVSYLSSADLCACCRVSRTWKHILTSNCVANTRRKLYLESKWAEVQEHGKENFHESKRVFAVSHASYNDLPRVNLTDIRNVYKSPSKQTPVFQQKQVSPLKTRYELFVQEASKLEPHQHLRPCPKCSSPSRVDPATSHGSCTHRNCHFVFCTRCMCDFHEGTVCRTDRARVRGVVSSRKSKTNLRRL